MFFIVYNNLYIFSKYIFFFLFSYERFTFEPREK